MKNITPTAPASPATSSQTRSLPHSPLATLSLPTDILLKLGTIYAGQSVTAMLAEDCTEGATANGVQAGLVLALHTILAPEQFRAVMIQWEVDAIKLSEMLELAGGES